MIEMDKTLIMNNGSIVGEIYLDERIDIEPLVLGYIKPYNKFNIYLIGVEEENSSDILNHILNNKGGML